MEKRLDSALQGTLKELPSDVVTPEVKQRFIKFGEHMDRLGRLDEQSDEVYVEEASLRKLLKEFFPPEFEGRFITEFRTLAGNRLIAGETTARGKLTPISWPTLASHLGKEIDRSSSTEKLEDLGLNRWSPLEEVCKAIRQRFPKIPDSILKPEAIQRRLLEIVNPSASASANEETALPDFFQVAACCSRRVGWWAMFAVLTVLAVAVIAYGIAIALLGVVGLTLFPIFWEVFNSMLWGALAVETLGIIFWCLVDPYS